MKKMYINPTIEIITSDFEHDMMVHSDDWADAKQQNMTDEPAEKKPLEDLQFRNIWDEEEEE